jgi:hypothetical protein
MRLLLISLTVVCLSAPVSAEVYRWKDADGNMQMSDHLPPVYAQDAYDVINPSTGRVIKHVERAPTPEEVAARKAAEAEAMRQAAYAKEQARKDRILRLTYGSVDEIRRARETRISILEEQARNTQVQIKDKLRELEDVEKRMAFFEEKEGQPPAGLVKKQLRIRDELNELNARLNRGQAQMMELDERFRADMERYLELEEIKAAEEAARR